MRATHIFIMCLCVCSLFFSHIHIKIAYAALSSCIGHKTHFTHTSRISMCICTHNRPIYCIHLAIFERRKKSILHTRNYMKLAFVNHFLSLSLSVFFLREFEACTSLCVHVTFFWVVLYHSFSIMFIV